MTLYEQRFGGLSRLYGEQYLAHAKQSHVCVVGIGGVGTWVVEALARSGIGKLTLVDLDDVCITNTNRQIHAYEGQVGKLKVEAMAERALLINPDLEIKTIADFFTAKTADKILTENFTYVVDAIDSIPDKCSIIAECNARNLPLLVSGAAGGKTDPTRIVIDDLARTQADNLLKALKRALKKHNNIEAHKSGLYNIPCVFSKEPAIMPWDVCTHTSKPENGVRIDCASGFGAASHVTGAFGLAMASYIVKFIANKHLQTKS